MGTADFAIITEGLRKRYGDTFALDGLDLQVPRGGIYGLLGPNGAGKTTAVRILATLQRYDEGRAEVAGFDVATQAAQVRYRIGLVGQNAAVDEVLDAHQNLKMFGRLFRLNARAARRRADDLLAQFGLIEAGNKPVKAYSGGMRRRLDLAVSMILVPTVLFLDEPTVGLDPRGRNEMWEAVRGLVDQGTTVLLTTQHLDEADQLADLISVVDRGRVIAAGPPDRLKEEIGGSRIDVVVHDRSELAVAASALAVVTEGIPKLNEDDRRISVPIVNRRASLAGAIRALDEASVVTEDIALRRPTLDEVFLHLTGRDPAEDLGAESAGLGVAAEVARKVSA